MPAPDERIDEPAPIECARSELAGGGRLAREHETLFQLLVEPDLRFSTVRRFGDDEIESSFFVRDDSAAELISLDDDRVLLRPAQARDVLFDRILARVGLPDHPPVSPEEAVDGNPPTFLSAPLALDPEESRAFEEAIRTGAPPRTAPALAAELSAALERIAFSAELEWYDGDGSGGALRWFGTGDSTFWAIVDEETTSEGPRLTVRRVLGAWLTGELSWAVTGAARS